MIRHYNKLIRDRRAEAISLAGSRAVTRTISDTDFRHSLLMKLVEETQEFLNGKKLEEEADIQEVLLKARTVYGYSAEDVELALKENAEDSTFGRLELSAYTLNYLQKPAANTEAAIQAALTLARAEAGYTTDDVERTRINKLAQFGAFDLGVYLEYTETNFKTVQDTEE
ncbi:MAG: phosphoribosyl-ATP pyrophosphohydrolase [Candidatus Saccharibacteria bacterium]|nr:phosphoribosyl-ATP pyrophosphohydrolase [Candidatus Saccharibacteria bacterium]